MRKNLPVTQREYPFPRGGTLVSTTDLKGRITYCNPSFIEVSGYSREELLGQAHNLIRHPDMPEEAFRDLWATIQSGKPWSALVKNRRKNGDHYWVLANVTPLLEGGRPIGYMSVRTEASREAIHGAEKLYATMRKEAEARSLVHVLSEGRVERRTIGGFLARKLRPSVGMRIVGGVIVATCLAVAMSRLALGAQSFAVALWAAAILGTLVGYLLQRVLTAPLQEVVSFANRMAAGDLTSSMRAGSSDEIGALQRALNQLTVNLRAIVSDARTEVERMRDVLAELASGNQDLSERTQAQAIRLQTTAASMEEIHGAVEMNTDSAPRASTLASEATQAAQHSNDAMLEVRRTMDGIREASARIGEVTDMIQGIAFQTNILALNAAVEAARAGDQGRGFAVVASEVRALAQSAAGAAKEITGLIGKATQKVKEGDEATSAASATMEAVLRSSRELHTSIEQIHTGSVEQQTGVTQVHGVLTDLDTFTQQNAALVEEITASAVSLSSQADTVVDAVQIFKLEGGSHVAARDAVALRREMKRQAAYG